MRFLTLWLFTLFFLNPNFCRATGDSISYLTLKDTIFLSIGSYGEKIFEHSLERKQTLFSLSRFYGLSVEELYYYNPGLKEKGTSIGQKIRVPIPNRAIKRYRDNGFLASEHVPIYYIVKKGDTMYRIAKYFFKMPVEELMIRNRLESPSLKAGQMLHVGWMHLLGIPEEYRHTTGGPLARRNQAMKKIYLRELGSRREYKGQGVGYWHKKSKDDSDLYALHRRAKINSVIAIENPMKKRTVYAKVIGKLPDTAYGDDIEVVLSPLAAKLLGAKDSRFFVKVRYRRR